MRTPTGRYGSSHVTWLERAALLVGAACLMTLWGAERRHLRDVRLQLDETSASLEITAIEREHLLHYLRSRTISAPFLHGIDGTADTTVMFQGASDGIYYLLDSRCPVCPRNYGLLHELITKGVTVVGLSRRDDVSSAFRHAQDHGVQFPIIVRPQGSLMDIMPAYGTPLTLVFQNGQLKGLLGGVIDGPRAEWLAALGAGSREPRQPPMAGR